MIFLQHMLPGTGDSACVEWGWILKHPLLARVAFGALPIVLVTLATCFEPPPAAAQAQVHTSPPASLLDSLERLITSDRLQTRFIIGLDKPASYEVFSLTAPNSVVVEISDDRVQLPADSDRPVGLIRAFRGGQSGPGKSRVVIYVTEPVVVETKPPEKSKDGRGYNLAIDIAAVAAHKASASPAKGPFPQPSALGAGSLGETEIQPPLPRPALAPAVRAARSYKPVIVIDPGHGGHDSGAQKYGLVEKDIALAFGKLLRARLEATGRYKILMTRDTDVFVPLDERREFAETNKAALFIAVHADYARPHARGATIFSLKETVADALRRSAKGDVSANVLSKKEIAGLQQTKDSSADVSVVRSMLADLAQLEVESTKERTGLISRSVIEFMGESTNLRDSPDRSAAFRVLKTAQVPAVLIELAFVSNTEDAKQLKSDEWRAKVADSIRTAIDNYFSHNVARLPM